MAMETGPGVQPGADLRVIFGGHERQANSHFFTAYSERFGRS
jgi:hypothetical protein